MKKYVTTKLFLLIIPLICLTGCEYELTKEFNVDISKPADSHPFTLDLNTLEDTVLIYGKVNFNYNFETGNLLIKSIDFTIGDKLIGNATSHSGVLTVNAGDFTAGIYKLKATMYTNSGTKSIADELGAEGYKVEKEWIIQIENSYQPTIKNPVVSRTNEGFLKISWDKCRAFNFDSYNLYLPSNGKVVITNRNITSIVDSMYIGGYNSVMMNVKLNTADGFIFSNDVFTIITTPYPEVKFEKVGFDNLRVYWNRSKYKTRYHLFVENHYLYNQATDLLTNFNDTSVVIHQAGFEDWTNYDLQIESFTTTNGRSPLINKLNSKGYYWGNYYEVLGGLNISYNQTENVLYSTVYGYLHQANINTLQIEKSVWWSPVTTGNNACPVNSSKVAVLTPATLFIYNNKNLDSAISMPLMRDPDYMSMSNNDIVVMTSRNNGLEYFDVAGNRIIASKALTSYTSANQWSVASTSNDAKYTCVVSTTGINIFGFTNQAVSTSYTGTEVYRSCLFDKVNLYQLYLTKQNSDILEIRNATDFSLVRTIKMSSSNALLCNVDPISGYLLTTDQTNAYILNTTTGKTLFSLRCISSKPRLFGGKLISGNGMFLDITEKIHE